MYLYTGSLLFVFRVCAGGFPSYCLCSATQENLKRDSLLDNAAAHCTIGSAKRADGTLFSHFSSFIKQDIK